LKQEIVKLEQDISSIGGLILKNIYSKECGRKEIEKLEAKIQEKKGCIMDEAKIDRITEERWDFVKFFMNNAGAIWESGNLAIKKDVQSLISPKGFVFRYGVIELKETPYL
jgi:hypothetical protein